MESEPITQAAREAVEALLDITRDPSDVQFLLDGLGVGSLAELKALVDDGRYYQHMRSQGMAFTDERLLGVH